MHLCINANLDCQSAWSGGNIALSVVPFWDSNGCTNVPYNDYFTNYDRCYYGFMTIIDG
jgi:hypothetical protein